MNEAEGVGVESGEEDAPGVEVEAGGAVGWESAGGGVNSVFTAPDIAHSASGELRIRALSTSAT